MIHRVYSADGKMREVKLIRFIGVQINSLTICTIRNIDK